MDHFPEDWRVGKAIAKRQGSQKLAGLNQTRTVTRSPDSLRRPVPFLRFACGAVTIGILCLSSETRSLLSRGTRASIEPNGRFASPLLPSPPNALAASTATRSAVIDPATVKDPNSLNAFSTTTAKSGAPVATNNLSSTPTRLAGFVYLDLNDDGAMSIDDTPITSVEIELTPRSDPARVDIEASVRVSGKTGVEMEAMTAVSVAGLTIYDMCKAVDREMTIGEIRLVKKSGGKSGTFIRKE